MTVVSVNAYDDADLLAECLASVREVLGNVRIQVVDGRYETFRPDAPDNSTDETPAVADAYGAEYWPDGPHADESAKHWARLDRAPDGEHVLFLDADERLLGADFDGLKAGTAYRIRIHNALMYDQDVTYYPRYFKPEWMEDIPRVDRFSFDVPVRRTDAITAVHRADLRGEAYREAKLDRFERENRDPWYRNYLNSLDERGFDHVEFQECPECGRESMTRSRVCGYDDQFTWVECCTAADGCYRTIREYTLEEWLYLPDAVTQGFEEDRQRVRAELMDAGNGIAKVVGPERFERYEPNARMWVERELEADDTRQAESG